MRHIIDPKAMEAHMTCHGQVKNGQIKLDEPVQLPEGTAVHVEVTPQTGRITRPRVRQKPQRIDPLRLPGSSSADELVRDRR